MATHAQMCTPTCSIWAHFRQNIQHQVHNQTKQFTILRYFLFRVVQVLIEQL